MSFSKEDKWAWSSSEVMRELEKIAMSQDLSGPPPEAYLPLKKTADPDWEEEGEEGFLDALEDFEGKEKDDKSLEWMETDEDADIDAAEIRLEEKKMEKARKQEVPLSEEPEYDPEHDEANLEWLDENVSGWGVDVDEDEEERLDDEKLQEQIKKRLEREKELATTVDKIKRKGPMVPFPPEAYEGWRGIFDTEASVLSSIEKLSWSLVDQNNIQAAYKVERALQEIKGILKGSA